MEIRKITEEEIVEELKKANPRFTNCIFPSDTKIDLSKFNCLRISLNNVEAHSLSFRNSKTKIGFWFEGCKKLNHLSFKNCILGYTRINLTNINGGLRFENCKADKFAMSTSTVIDGWLNFDNCVVKENIQLTRVDLTYGLKIYKCEQIGWIRIDGLECFSGALAISKSIISDYVICANSIHLESIQLHGSKFGSRFVVEGGILKRLLIEECDFERSFSFNYKNSDLDSGSNMEIIDVCRIEKTFFGDGFELVGNDNINFIVNELILFCNESLKGDMVFKNLTLTNLLIKGILSNGNLSFAGIITKEIQISGFDNQANFKLRHIVPLENSTFALVNSDLGNAYLNDIDFNKFSKVIINKSTLSNIHYSDIKWSDKIEIAEEQFEPDGPEKDIRLHNSYRQLKQAASNNQNKIDELLFRGKEWHFIQKAGVNKNEAWYWRLNDWIILFSNKSNSFGTNWINPILWLLVSNLFFFVLILIGINEKVSIFEWSQPLAIGDLLTLCYDKFWLYLHFLNPTHNLKHFEPLLPSPEFTGFINNGWAMTLNVLMRLTTAYFIYQTISAFRKFSKK